MKHEQDTSGADSSLDGAERTLRVLCHELSGLIDGASRYVEMARKDCAAEPACQDAAKFLATATTALGEAARMLRSVRLGRDEARAPISRLASLRPAGESVDHAIDLARIGRTDDAQDQVVSKDRVCGKVAGNEERAL